jgi:cysteine dioxygenase
VAKPLISVATFVDRLRAIEGGPVTSDRVAELIDSAEVDEKTLRPFVRFADDHYTRHLVHRDRHFDVMLLCWQPGMGTPVHTHNGQLGWAVVTRGALECVEYRWLGCDSPERQNVGGLDCLAGGGEVRLERTHELVCTPGGPMNRVTREVTIHSLAVPHDARERVVSLHVYSLPFDSCVVFDVAQGRCARRELAFDTVAQGYQAPLRG